MEQAITALMERRRIARIRATLRTQKVRTAVLEWERAQEDAVAKWLDRFNDHCPSALVGLLRSAAGCRWAIAYWSKLAQKLQTEGTWLGAFRVGAIQLTGQSACWDELFFYEEAFTTTLDCMACQSNPKQRDLDCILHPRNVPPTLQDSDVPLWPRDPAASRARLQAHCDRELPRLKALETSLRILYEEPAKAEAEVMALASLSRDEMQLIRAEQIHEQSYLRASTALLNARKQTAAARAAAAPEREDSLFIARPLPLTGQTPSEAVRTQVVGESGGSDEDLPRTDVTPAIVARSRHRVAGRRTAPRRPEPVLGRLVTPVPTLPVPSRAARKDRLNYPFSDVDSAFFYDSYSVGPRRLTRSTGPPGDRPESRTTDSQETQL